MSTTTTIFTEFNEECLYFLSPPVAQSEHEGVGGQRKTYWMDHQCLTSVHRLLQLLWINERRRMHTLTRERFVSLENIVDVGSEGGCGRSTWSLDEGNEDTCRNRHRRYTKCVDPLTTKDSSAVFGIRCGMLGPSNNRGRNWSKASDGENRFSERFLRRLPHDWRTSTMLSPLEWYAIAWWISARVSNRRSTNEWRSAVCKWQR